MADRPKPGEIDAFRSFNRFYTQRIGVLQEGLLGSRFPLAQARVLFELGTREGLSASGLGAALGLDAGYLSRILRRLTQQGLVHGARSASDRRRVVLGLTEEGRGAFEVLNASSRREARAVLERLPGAQRARLLEALRTAQALLAGADRAAHAVRLRRARPGDAGWAIERHARVYREEYGWNEEFEALVAGLFARFLGGHDEAAERFWVAELDGERAGCVFLVRNGEDATLAQLRCLLVEPGARGHGIGRRLVGECIGFARAAGYPRMMLWTNDVLVSARRIYQAAGFRLTREEAHHSFGHDLVAQIWERDLDLA